jgi:hypothetical protein
VVERLPSKYEALSSNSSTNQKKKKGIFQWDGSWIQKGVGCRKQWESPLCIMFLNPKALNMSPRKQSRIWWPYEDKRCQEEHIKFWVRRSDLWPLLWHCISQSFSLDQIL